MSIEALWSMQFASPENIGAGVVVLQTGRIFGGDGRYYYLGQYQLQGRTLRARVDVHHYSGEPYSVFGKLQHFTLDLSGHVHDSTMFCTGSLVEEPDRKLDIFLERRADLP